jgi:xanthine dehydrogenase molybdenum-binding subunit
VDKVEFMVNGNRTNIEVAPGEMLSDVLRYRLGLTGTKIGCNESECGACTVILDDQPVLSCNLPAMKVHGRSVQTIEGLAQNSGLHALQESFIKYGAVQCGFCTPGQLMMAAALLEENPDPTEDEIRQALKTTLCRCGAYPAIIRAIQASAQSIHSGEPASNPGLSVSDEFIVVGRMAYRPDAVAKVTGSAKFSDDYAFPEMLHGRVLRAGIPHATLIHLDIKNALEYPGVHAVLTAEDIPGERKHGIIITDWPVLVEVGERVRYVGDAVALVAAETREIADLALDLIETEYQPLPVVTNAVAAKKPESPFIFENGNLLKHIKVSKGDIEQGFADADVIFEEIYFTPPMDHVFMEPECSIARAVEDGRIEVYVGSQIPYADREQIAACLSLTPEKVRVIGTMVGGGFGGKEDIAGQIHAAMLAQVTDRPVKILFDRHESFLTHPKRHATRIKVRLGAKQNGRLVAAEIELFGDTGAYASLGEKVLTRTTTHSIGPYVVPHVRAECYAMHTNNPPAGAFRGFGVPQSAFAIESAMDSLAAALMIDPISIRRLNALQVGDTTCTGQLINESAGLLECLDRVEAEMLRLTPGSNPFDPRTSDGHKKRRRAWGFAAAFKNTGLGGGTPDKAGAEIELIDDGRIEVRTSSAELGQGLVTVLQIIAAEELGMRLDQVDVLLSDTDLTPDGGPTTASRQTYVSGNAVRYAASLLRKAMRATLCEIYNCPPGDIKFTNGSALVESQQIPFNEVATLMRAEGKELCAVYEYHAPETQPLGLAGDMHFAYSFAAQAAEVEVDLETGEVRVINVISANDVGKAINPLGLQGQIEGGVIMGVGHALTEKFIVDEGRVITDRMARYRMPSIKQTPEIISIVVEHPTRDGPYGAKGVGELTIIPTIPAITNAIFNACGVRVKCLPVDQDWLARELANRV